MSEAIAATPSIALAMKMKMMFETNDKYLAFPMGGLSFSYKELEFMKEPESSSLSLQEQVNYRGQFSRLCNIIPEDKATFPLSADKFLWDEMKRILIQCIFPVSRLTPSEGSQLNEAIDFLTNDVTINSNSVPVNSPEVEQYYKYKTLYDLAYDKYNDEEISAQNATGLTAEKAKKRWIKREKTLKKKRDTALTNWTNLGYKNPVEGYISLKNRLELKKYPSLYIQSYLNEINISEIADLNGGVGLCTTFFSPSDSFDQTSPWASITLTKIEIDGLIAKAPDEIRNLFGTDQGSANIESISIEYNNIILMRPWLKPEFFQSHNWKLEGTEVVSDGKTPRQGTLPAYITSLLVVRSIRITRKKTETTSLPVVLPLLSTIPITRLQTSTLDAKALETTNKPIAPFSISDPMLFSGISAVQDAPALPAETAEPAVSHMAIKTQSVSPLFIRPRSFVQDEPAPPTEKTQPFMMKYPLLSSEVARTSFVRRAEAQEINSIEIKERNDAYATTKYAGTTIVTPSSGTTTSQDKTDPRNKDYKTSDFVTENFTFNNGVIVLALVCKRLPLAPDPDPTLQWE